MPNILIAALPGIGKTETVKYLREYRGRDAIDVDDIEGLTKVVDAEGNLVPYDPYDPDFVRETTLMWDEAITRAVLLDQKSPEYRYLAGPTTFDLLDLISKGLFSKSIYLHANRETHRERLTSPNRIHPENFGGEATDEQQIDDILDFASLALDAASSTEADIIDTSNLSVSQVGELVISLAEEN